MQQPPASTQGAATDGVPIILIENWTRNTPITEHYICGDNELDFCAIYKKIKRPLTRPRCPHRSSEIDWPCSACESSYLEIYWSSAAQLLDYFADFLHVDTPIMQYVWFHLLDVWQKTANYFPHKAIIAAHSVSPQSQSNLDKARWFEGAYEETLELMNTVLLGVKNNVHEGPIIHTPSGDVNSPTGRYNTGPYISGLKPWQQFLRAGGPGVAAPSNVANTSNAVHYVPMAAIAIIKKHTERARAIAAKVNPDPEFLNKFDQNCVQFPDSTTTTHTYQSITGSTMSYRLVNGAPPITRPHGYEDPDLLQEKPSLTLLDDGVAMLKGVEAYQPVSGKTEEDVEEDGKDEEAFDMWAVHESGRAGGGEKSELATKLGEVFENWCTDEE